MSSLIASSYAFVWLISLVGGSQLFSKRQGGAIDLRERGDRGRREKWRKRKSWSA